MLDPISLKAGTGVEREKIVKGVNSAAFIPVKGKTVSESRNPEDAKEFFLRRIQICSVTYDYSDDNKDVRAKSERLTALQELREFLNDSKNVATYVLPHLEQVLEMVRKNIYRPLPMDKKSADKLSPSEGGLEDEDIIIDPAWPHIQGVYGFFLN